MGSGNWTSEAFESYSRTFRGMSAAEADRRRVSAQEIFRARGLSSALDPRGVTRECHDSDEHPNTLPVILALDVTGSMGSAAAKTATGLNNIITEIFRSGSIKDVEFCVMGIGDIHYDRAPIQISQFESDIRIAEQMDDIFFEGGGGGNNYESYTAAWYMGARHCDLHCWKRGKKGLIITLGDELPNHYLNASELGAVTGDRLQADVETGELLREVREKFDVYHLSVDDSNSCYQINQRRNDLDKAWTKLLGADHYRVVTLNSLSTEVSDIIERFAMEQNGEKEKRIHLW